MTHRSAVRRLLPVVFALFLVLLLVGAASSGVAEGAGTVRAKVQYRDGTGAWQALAGVEVFLWDSGRARYACTNDNGVATFREVGVGGRISATGVSLSKHCANAEFLEPGTGLKLYAVYYNQHVG